MYSTRSTNIKKKREQKEEKERKKRERERERECLSVCGREKTWCERKSEK